MVFEDECEASLELEGDAEADAADRFEAWRDELEEALDEASLRQWQHAGVSLGAGAGALGPRLVLAAGAGGRRLAGLVVWGGPGGWTARARTLRVADTNTDANTNTNKNTNTNTNTHANVVDSPIV